MSDKEKIDGLDNILDALNRSNACSDIGESKLEIFDDIRLKPTIVLMLILSAYIIIDVVI